MKHYLVIVAAIVLFALKSCNPSRSALMSGLAPQNTGMYLNMQVWREVLGDVKTIPQYFTDNELISVIKVLEELS